MGLFSGLSGLIGGGGQSGVGNKSNTSSTSNATTNEYTDTSANAGGDGSIAASGGGSVVINDLSETVARDAIAAGVNQTARTLATAEKLTEFTTNTIRGLSETSARENAATRDSADLSLRTTAGLVSTLQQQTSDALERAQQPEASSVTAMLKPLLWVIGGIVALVLILSSKKAK